VQKRARKRGVRRGEAGSVFRITNTNLCDCVPSTSLQVRYCIICDDQMKNGIKNGIKNGMGNGELEMENGEWRMGNEEWGMENGEWRMGNGEWRMGNGDW